MSVAEICRRDVICVAQDRSVQEVAELMRQEHVGAVVVVEDERAKQRAVGMVTDRDIVVEICAARVDPNAVTAADIMSRELLAVAEHDDVFRTIKQMRSHKVRRVPVVDTTGRVSGILSLDDILDTLAEALSDLAWLTMSERDRERSARP